MKFIKNIFAKIHRKKKSFQRNKSEKKKGDLKDRIKSFFNIKRTIVLISVILVLLCLSILVTIGKAWVEFNVHGYEDAVTNLKEWRGDSKLTILIVGIDEKDKEHQFIDGLAIYTLNPSASNSSIFVINPDLNIPVSFLDKPCNIRTLLQNKYIKGNKSEALTNTISELLALRIDRYVMVDINKFNSFSNKFSSFSVNLNKSVFDEDSAKFLNGNIKKWGDGNQMIRGNEIVAFLSSDSNGKDDQLKRQKDAMIEFIYSQINIGTIIQSPSILKDIEQSIYTNLSKGELVYIYDFIKNTKKNFVKGGYIRSNSYSEIQSISFYKEYFPIYSELDDDLKTISYDVNIFKEQPKIEIINSSNIKGLAANRSRWISNLGARVVKIGNGIEYSENTKIYCKNPNDYKFTLQELDRVFNCKAEFIYEDYTGRSVGDIVIDIGSDYK